MAFPLSPPRAALALLAATLTTQASEANEGGPVVLMHPPGPAGGANEACSFRHPMCVAGGPRTARADLLATLAAADAAWETLTGAVALPPPDGDLDGRWRLYLAEDEAEEGRAALTGLDPRTSDDRGRSFGVIPAAPLSTCLRERAVARAIAWGSLLRSAPATDLGTARAETEMLARLATPCPALDADTYAFQATPERALVDPESPAAGAGAWMFFDWLDRSLASRPAALVGGLWALAPTKTPPSAPRWPATPTGFDVLRSSLKGRLGTDSTLDDALLAFAVDRGLAFPRPRLAWHVPWPEHARRFASPTPVTPTGASYVLVDHAGARAGASLRVEATWEDFGRMRWAIVKVDATGAAMAVLPIASPPRAKSAAITVELVDETAGILVVGANVGSTECAFDPNQGSWEPHGWLLTIEAL